MSEYWTAKDQLQARWAYDKPAGRDNSMVRKRGHSMFDKKYRHYREPHHYTTPKYFHCAQSFIDENGNKKLTEGAKIYTEWKDLYKEEDEKYFAQDKAEHDARRERKRTLFNTGQSIWRNVAGAGVSVTNKPAWKYRETQKPLEPIDLTRWAKRFRQIPRDMKMELPLEYPEEEE